MLRSLRFNLPKSKVSSHSKNLKCPYSSSPSSSGGGGGKVVFGVLAAAGAGFAGAVFYGKYDPKFKKVLQDNLPYIDEIYKLFPNDDHTQKPVIPTKSVSEEKAKDATMADSLLKKKLEREKREREEKNIPERVNTHNTKNKTEIQKSLDAKTKSPVPQTSDSKIPEPFVKISETSSTELNVQSVEKQEAEQLSNENLVSDVLNKLDKNSEETKVAYETAVEAVRQHTKFLYEALDLPEGKDRDIVWKEVEKAGSDKNDALKSAEQRASETRDLMERLKVNINKLAAQDKRNPLIKNAEETLSRVANQIKNAQAEVKIAETEAKTATEYQNLVNASKEQFEKELQIVLPNYVHSGKDKPFSESDLNLLIAHAHRRIEQLQKQLAKQQVTEKIRVDEAVKLQKMKDEKFTNSKIKAELERRNIDLESAIADRVAHLKDNFENELRQQLRRQAAAHADHIEEVLKMKNQELERKFSLDLEEKLLHQKGIFISEMSGNMSRLRGILAFLKAKSEFDNASKKAQALWLACQAMSHKIFDDNAGNPLPLGRDIAAIKIAADEESEFINAVLAGIPTQAVNRGVYNNEVLKERFQDVKKACKKVALIDENNDSLYRYFLSFVQSFFIVDAVNILKEEIEGKVAVDPSEWDTFDILNRVSYCLKINNLEQALRYANQLKGEPRVVAKVWMHEVKLLLETQLAVKALLAHAAAVGVQAYH